LNKNTGMFGFDVWGLGFDVKQRGAELSRKEVKVWL
jgi:hypothetical protein